MNSQNHLLKQGEHTTNNVVTNRSILTNNMISKTFNITPEEANYEFSMDDITTYTPPTSPGGPGGGISLFITYYDYTVRVYKGNSTTAFYTTQFNLSNATRVINFATDSTTSQIRIEISRGLATTQGYSKYVDNLKLRKFTGNTSVYNTNYSNMSLTANALDGWSPDNWSTTSATVDQAAGQYRLVAIGSGATAKVQREFTAMPNQEHRFQYNLSLLNGGSTTVRVEQKVNGVYQYLATQQTQTTSGTYELSFVPSETDIRISVSGTSRYALQNLYLDRDQIDTLVATYALSRGYRYGSDSYRNQGMEKDDEVKGAGNSVNYTYRMHDPRLGRFFAVDPLASSFPWNSVYAFSENNVIHMVEMEGLEKAPPKVHYYNMVGQDDGGYKPEYSHSHVKLVVKTSNSVLKICNKQETTKLLKGDHGVQGTTTNVYTYWNSNGTINSQEVLTKSLSSKNPNQHVNVIKQHVLESELISRDRDIDMGLQEITVKSSTELISSEDLFVVSTLKGTSQMVSRSEKYSGASLYSLKTIETEKVYYLDPISNSKTNMGEGNIPKNGNAEQNIEKFLGEKGGKTVSKIARNIIKKL